MVWIEFNVSKGEFSKRSQVRRCINLKDRHQWLRPLPCKQVVNPATLRMCPCGKKTIDSRYISIRERKWEYFSSSRECRIYFRKKTTNPYIHAAIVIDDVQSWRGNIALYQRFNPVSLLNCTKITLHVQKTRLTYGQPWRSGCIDIFTQRF